MCWIGTWSSSNPLEKTESIKHTKSFNKAPAQAEIQFADEGRIKLHSLITSRRPSVSSGAPQQLCYQHGLPQRRQSPRQPRPLPLASDEVGCVASETEHSPGTRTEFPTLLCTGCIQELLTLPCPSGPTTQTHPPQRHCKDQNSFSC